MNIDDIKQFREDEKKKQHDEYLMLALMQAAKEPIGLELPMYNQMAQLSASSYLYGFYPSLTHGFLGLSL